MLLTRLVNIKPGEVRAALWSCLYFFCILASYFILRPIRDEAGVAGGIRNLPWLFTATMIGMLLVNPAFAALVARFQRSKFVPMAYRFFILNLIVFFFLFTQLGESSQIWVGRVFYVWTSVFNLFVVSVFWGFMADSFSSEQAKRLFGFIGVGGTLGSALGSAVTATFVSVIGTAGLLIVSAVLLEIAVQCVNRLAGQFAGAKDSATGAKAPPPQPIGGGIWDGVRNVIKSPYLLGIAGYMMLYTIGSTFLYFQQAGIVEAAYQEREARTALFAKIDLATNLITAFVQMFITGRLMLWLGVAGALTVVPILSILGFLSLGFFPSVAVLVAFQVARRAGNFAVARPSREVLYTVVSREDKFKAKSFNDTFVYRLGDQVGAWADPLLKGLGLSMTGIALVAAPISAIWMVVGYWLGRRQAQMAAEQGLVNAPPVERSVIPATPG
mgnify:CR=1 FL=1